MGITLKQLTDTVSQIKDYILNKTHKIDQISYAQKTVNTELDYCYCTQGPTEVSYQNDGSMAGKIKYVTPTSYNTNMEYNTEENYVLLKAGKKYFISATIRFTGTGITNTSQCLVGYNVVNKDTGLVITAQGVDQTVILSPTSGTECIGCATPNEDIKVMLGITWLSGKITAIPSATMVIQEIGHDILIDPVEYVNQHDGIEDSPIGHIISHMGTAAPKHYLICDGTIYNIVDYPYLAQHMIDNFGKVNYFGGNGTTTFAVPDLRGEFLRGSGTATRNTGSGATVGVHQDGTKHIDYWNSAAGWIHWPNEASTVSNADKKYTNTKGGRLLQGSTDTSKQSLYTSRPTNTAVLYCIKYEPTYYMQVKNTNYMQPTLYSEEERVIGSWINGKPLYQKVLKFDTIPNDKNFPHDVDNVEKLWIFGGEVVISSNTNTKPTSDISSNNTSSSYTKWLQQSLSNAGYTIGIDGKWGNGTNNVLNSFKIANGLTANGILDEQTINLLDKYNNYIIPVINGDFRFYKTNYISTTITNIVNVIFVIQYTKTTDEENSFTTDMIKDYVVQTGETKPYSDEEVINAINDLW